MGFVYKIENTITKKCYIGVTRRKNPQSRWTQHKQKISKGIGCPALQDAVKRYGIENFNFCVILECNDEILYEEEKRQIQEHNSQVPNGYNLTPGGEGGGFYGKKHSEESKQKIRVWKQNLLLNEKETQERNAQISREKMKTDVVRQKIREGMRNSNRWNEIKSTLNKDKIKNHVKQKKEDLAENEVRLMKKHNSITPNRYNITTNGKGGGFTGMLHTEETKNKIKASLSKQSNGYFSDPNNILKQRECMAQSVGKKVYQYDDKNTFVKDFISCSEAARQTGFCKATIQNGLKTPNQLRCGYYWREGEHNDIKS
jgi:group I intron endonuclease